MARTDRVCEYTITEEGPRIWLEADGGELTPQAALRIAAKLTTFASYSIEAEARRKVQDQEALRTAASWDARFDEEATK